LTGLTTTFFDILQNQTVKVFFDQLFDYLCGTHGTQGADTGWQGSQAGATSHTGWQGSQP
jgi:hypothetical protein